MYEAPIVQKEPLAFALVCKYGSRHSCENICKYKKNSRRIYLHIWLSQYLWEYLHILLWLSSLLIKYLQKWPSPELQNISMLGKYVSEKLLMHYKLPYFLIDSHVFSYFPHSAPPSRGLQILRWKMRRERFLGIKF